MARCLQMSLIVLKANKINRVLINTFLNKLQNFVWVLWNLWVSHFELIIILKQFWINNIFVEFKVRVSTSNKKIQIHGKWSEVIWNRYYFTTYSWSYIENGKLIHQLFFVILVCLLPCSFKAYRWRKLYFRWMNGPLYHS